MLMLCGLMPALRGFRDGARHLLTGAIFVLLTLVVAPPVWGEGLRFSGRVEAKAHALVYSRVEGMIETVHVAEGDFVTEGQVLVTLKSDRAALALAAAEAELAQATARVEQAQADAARAERLADSGTGSDRVRFDSEVALRIAQAERAAALAARDTARTLLADMTLRAPRDGFVEDVTARAGALVEFDAGMPPLMQIIGLDPVRITYDVPYDVRMASLSHVASKETQALFEQLSLTVTLPSGETVADGLKPQATSIALDVASGTLTVWTEAPNSDGILRPGLQVEVISTLPRGE